MYYTATIGSLSFGQPLVIELEYQKDDDELSINNLEVGPTAPIEGTQSMLLTALPWVLGILGVALIVGGIYWYWQSGRQRPAIKQRSRHKSESAKEIQPSEGYIYCHQCGKRALTGDRFCRVCGTQLRSSNGK